MQNKRLHEHKNTRKRTGLLLCRGCPWQLELAVASASHVMSVTAVLEGTKGRRGSRGRSRPVVARAEGVEGCNFKAVEQH